MNAVRALEKYPENGMNPDIFTPKIMFFLCKIVIQEAVIYIIGFPD
jgi:hypothetical protein